MSGPPDSLFDWSGERREDASPRSRKASLPSAAAVAGRARFAAAAVGLAVAGLAAPVAVATFAATGPLRGSPLLAGLLVALLVLAPAASCVTAALSGIGLVAAQIDAAGNEAELAVLRVLADTLLFGYALALAPADCVAVAVAALVAAWAMLLCLLCWPAGAPPLRRHGGLALDMALFSAFLHFGGAAAAGWYPLYLLAMVHAGLRLGLDALLVSAIAGVLGFAGVTMSTEFWRLQPALAGGLLFTLAAVPACLAGAVHALTNARDRASGAEAQRQTALRLIADTLRAPPESRRTTSPSPLADILDFAALEAGTFSPPVETFDLRTLIRHSLSPVQRAAAEQRVRLSWRVDPLLPDRLRGHAAALSRILGGLAMLTLATAPAGAVRIAVEPAAIEARRVRLKLRIDGLGPRRETLSDDYSALSLKLIERLVKMADGTFAVERPIAPGGARARLVVTLPLLIEPGVSRRALDLGHRVVLLATEDDELARDLAEPLAVWNAQPSWPEDIEAALGGLGADCGEQRPIVIVDGRDKLLSALSFAHRAAQVAAQPFIILIAMPAQIDGLGQVEEDGLDSLLPAPVSESLLANALDALPLATSRPEIASGSGGRTSPPAPRSISPPPDAVETAGDRITPIAAHPRFAAESTGVVDARVIEGLRALGGGPDFLGELIETFRADAQQGLQRLGQAAAVVDAAGFARGIAALRRSAGQLGGTQLCELLASLEGLAPTELRQRGAGHVQRLAAEIERFAAALSEFLPTTETRRR